MSNIIKTRAQGNLIVISAPSGAGKGSIIEKLMEKRDDMWLSISMTSRAMRDNDIADETYYFVSKEEFEKRIRDGFFFRVCGL